MRCEKYGGSRHWAVYDDIGQLVCITVYRKGAQEVIRRLESLGCRDIANQSKQESVQVKKILNDISTASRQIQKLTKELLPQLEV